MLDVNTFIGAYPYRHLPHPDPDVLVRVLEHQSNQFGGEAVWDVRNRNNQVVASGVYFFHIEAGDARKVGRFTVVNFAQ